MASIIKADNLQKVSDDSNIIKKCGSTITVGSSGATVALASGASQTGFGTPSSSVLWFTTAKTSPLTAADKVGYFLNTTGGVITVTLPLSPSAGDVVAFKDYASTWQTNKVTICNNSSKINVSLKRSILPSNLSELFNQHSFFDSDTLNLTKTHNCLYPYKKNNFTSKNETIGAIYIVRDPRNLITSLKHHYSIDYEKAMEFMMDENSSLLEKSHDNDFSNFTYLNSWSNHYSSWKSSSDFKTLFIKYEDLEKNRTEIFKKIIFFVNEITENNQKIDEKKLSNSIKTTNFSNLKNKELNEGFEESVYSKNTGKKINFFNLGFNNRWQKILPIDIKSQANQIFKKNLNELDYLHE